MLWCDALHDAAPCVWTPTCEHSDEVLHRDLIASVVDLNIGAVHIESVRLVVEHLHMGCRPV
jgi:hypothetical protein